MKNNPIPHSPYMPFDPAVELYSSSYGHLTPWEFSGWKNESMSWKTGCYLHAGLNPNFRKRIKGPDAMRLIQDACINDFTRFSIGASKHGVMCNELGNTMAEGMILRIAEDEFEFIGHGPYVDYLVESSSYRLKSQDVDSDTFLFQIAGPRSLEVVEALTGENLRDLEFLWHRPSRLRIAELSDRTIDIRVYRLGVSRTLAYEVHGDIRDAQTVYKAIMKAGEDFGIERLGMQGYGLNHTEGGFAQSFIHYLHAWTEDDVFMNFLSHQSMNNSSRLPGSAGQDISKRYANPYELGIGHLITFDHSFRGREALECIARNPKRKIVTLEWDRNDVIEIYASQFRDGADIQFMDFAANPIWQGYMSLNFADDILSGDKIIGISSGRMFSYYYKKMISLGIMDIDHANLGESVEVLWGDPGSRQKRIRAVVSRFPYIDLPFNRNIDTSRLSSAG
ncbi:glycine cleavage system aminomethyltransferase T [Pseudomonas sp. BIGb0408]|uniref:Glycine cleavage system aminomethyltransferase T n=1 Tax=Phytopseudomonas flavescens TaxID=29435 RepID=A0A7Y9XKM2_9GAMM|nr:MULTISPECIES: hypothetical protein [Pseudomonas]MCW2292307.1 glycine cleavage system aminomethyltransferase T [Pseudomonas sp. BIGb0408]NYH73121.1 glycine cleavage system aminomethyltransferase T [Pseudomonas flavescens]